MENYHLTEEYKYCEMRTLEVLDLKWSRCGTSDSPEQHPPTLENSYFYFLNIFRKYGSFYMNILNYTMFCIIWLFLKEVGGKSHWKLNHVISPDSPHILMKISSSGVSPWDPQLETSPAKISLFGKAFKYRFSPSRNSPKVSPSLYRFKN